MKTENMTPVVRQIVRYVAMGFDDDAICELLTDFEPSQIAKMRAGSPFKRAVADLQDKIDAEMVERAGEDPVRAYLRSKGMSAAKTLVELAENHDEETPHAVRAKAADSLLSKGGFNKDVDEVAVPVLMLSPEKLKSVLDPKSMALDKVPDSVDGHNGGLGTINAEDGD